MSAQKNYPRGVGRGICGYVGCAHTPTYTEPLLTVDLFSVDSLISNGSNIYLRSIQPFIDLYLNASLDQIVPY